MAAYKKMDQKTLDREYSARGTVSDAVFEAAIANYTQLSEHCRQSLDCGVDIPYGSSPDEVLDIFPAGDNTPLFIFIHGGYWRALSQKESSFMAEAFTKRGVAVAAVNYSLAPEASLDEIVRQCRSALTWTYDNAKSFGVDRNRIHVGGSSAGGHLVGMMLAGGWHGEVDFLSRAGIQQTRFRKHSVVALGDPRCARTGGGPVGGYSVFGPVLDQYPVVLVDGRHILKNHHHRITRFGLQLRLVEFQTITIGGYRKRAHSGVR